MVTISSIFTNLNSYVGDSSNDRVTEAERLQAVTEATAWLLEELGNEHMVETYNLSYFDTVNYYKVTGTIPDLLTGADLRREKDNYYSFARKSPRELSEEIARKDQEPSWAIERKNDDIYLAVNAEPRNKAANISYLEGINDGGGTWVVDATGSDATNLRADNTEKRYGGSSLAFDVDVSQSVNNRATIYNANVGNSNLESLEDTGSFLVEIYIPDATETTSVTYHWGSAVGATPATKTNYWSATVTTDMEGNDFISGWNTVKIDWSDATATGTPNASACVYAELTINYSGSQVDDTFYRVNYLRCVKPEILVFHYISWNVGQVSSVDTTPVTAFTATTNVPFFSGKYDQYKYPVAQKAAAIIFSTLRLREEALDYESQSMASLTRFKKNFESSKVRPVKSFKIMGVNLRRRNKSGRIR